MSAIDKEKVFEELRNYHTEKFPAKIKNTQLEILRADFIEMEDQIVSMILSLVNGKAEFVDPSKELAVFQKKLDAIVSDPSDASRKVFTSKITKLEGLIAFSKNSDFKLKRIRPNKYANRVPTNKVTVT